MASHNLAAGLANGLYGGPSSLQAPVTASTMDPINSRQADCFEDGFVGVLRGRGVQAEEIGEACLRAGLPDHAELAFQFCVKGTTAGVMLNGVRRTFDTIE